METYFSYTRVSTQKQGEHGVSLQEQRDAIERYAKSRDLKITEWFEERMTAAKSGRPEFLKMLKLLNRKKAKGVIIHKIDRSARNLKDWAMLGEMIDQGVEVHFANESLDLHSRGGRLSADIQAVVAADFIRNLQQETKKGMYGRLKQGLFPMRAPHGYLDCGPGKPKEPDPAVSPLIKCMFEKYETAKYNLKDISEEMFRLGLRSWSGKRLDLNGISRILNNPFYAGIIQIAKSGETFRGIHQPLISIKLFDRVQLILKGKYHRRTQSHDFLYSRLLTCKNCHYSLIGSKVKGNTYYRCNTRGCPSNNVREDLIDNVILRKFERIQLTDIEVQYFESKLSKFREEFAGLRDQQIQIIQLQLKNISYRLDRLTDALLDGLIDKPEFERRKTNLLFEQKEMEEKLVELEDNFDKIPEKMLEYLQLAKSLYLTYKLGIPEEKRDLLKLVTCNRFVAQKNLDFMLKKPFDELENRQIFTSGVPHRGIPATFISLMTNLIAHFSQNIDDLSESIKQ